MLRRAVARLTEDDSVVADRELQHGLVSAGATAVSKCQKGQPVCVSGTLRAVTLRPRAGVPTLEAELYDGSGTVTLVWLGRRQIAGIDPGRQLTVHGRLGCSDGRKVLFNPRYELSA